MRKYASLQLLDAWSVPSGGSRQVLRKAAHRVAFSYTPRPGYLYVRSRMISSRTNDNHDTFPAPEIEKAYQTFLGKPVFVNHHNANHKRARGVIVAVALHRDRNPDGTPDSWVEGLMEIDAVRFPRLCKAILVRRITRTSMGVDVGWSRCSACGNTATSPAEYCGHLPAMKGKKIRARNQRTGKIEEKLIHEVCHRLAFFENSLLVEDPADPTSHVLGEPDARGLRAAASRVTAAPVSPHPGRLQGGDCRDYCTYGGTHCLVCHEPVKINLHKTDTPSRGWHHADSVRRDHHALPADEDTVMASIPAQQAAKDQARAHVQDVLEQQGLPRRQPAGMPPDPFTRQAAAVTDVTFGPADTEPFGLPLGVAHAHQVCDGHLARTGSVPGTHVHGNRRGPGSCVFCEREGMSYQHRAASFGDVHEQAIDAAAGGAEGFSVHPRTGRSPGSGFMVAMQDRTHTYPAEVMNDRAALGRAIHHTVHSERDAFENDPSAHIGGWVHGGKLWIEPSHHIHDEHEATVAGKNRNQIAIWDIARSREIPTGGTGGGRITEHDSTGAVSGIRHASLLRGPAGQLLRPAAASAAANLRGDRRRDHRAADGQAPGGQLGFTEAAGPKYSNPADHPWFQANPVHKDHIIAAYHDTTPDERSLGDRWYADAHHVAKSISGGDAHKGAGVLSAYSPQTAWPVNLLNASRAFQGDPPGPGSGAMGMHQKPAMQILGGMHHQEALKGPKTQDFAHLIEHGRDTPEDEAEGGRRRVVVDRHALSTAVGRRMTKEDATGAPLDNRHYYEHAAQTYRDAADHLSQHFGRKIAPHQVQAAVWLRQIRKNQEEDSSGARGGAGKGRIVNDTNSKSRWQEHRRQHHPDITEENMHHRGVRQALAYGETRVPQQVDTLRMEECPVCGESSVWSGQRCQVCGFVVPPHLFQDPDTGRARQVRDELDSGGEVDLPPEGGQGSYPDASEQLYHPEQIAPNGVPGGIPGTPEPDGDEQEEDQQGGGVLLNCPACGAGFGPQDKGAQAGAPCPACQQAPLEPSGPQKDQEDRPGEEDDDMAGAKTAAQNALLARLAAAEEENAVLRTQIRFIAQLAGCGTEVDEVGRRATAQLRSQADMANPASPVPDPPQQPATQSTEQALQSGSSGQGGQGGTPERGTGHTEDDPARPGSTPGGMENVPAAQTTTAITPGVEIQTPPATNLTDVTAPVTGTNPSQDGGVPIEQRRVETDVRVNPDPVAAHGPGIGGQGDSGAAFPWVLQAREGARDVPPPQTPEDVASVRVYAAMRLARLRIAHGMARGDELAVAETIEKDAARLPLPVIEHEIAVLSQVRPPQRRAPAPSQHTAARQAPSLQAVGGAAFGYPATVPGEELDAADIFLSE